MGQTSTAVIGCARGRPGRLLGLVGACLVLLLVQPPRADAAELWTGTGSLAVGRAQHTATALPNGKVLVTGGRVTDVSSTATAELYDPATRAWSSAGSMAVGRAFHTATLLANGRVLVAGGVGVTMPTAELFDPAGGWTVAPSLATARSRHTATPLADGRVLVAGGVDGTGTPTGTVELFDPAADMGAGGWSAGPALATPRAQHTATLLSDGKVLVTGGTTCAEPPPQSSGCPTETAELFDPGANGGAGAWSAAASSGAARFDHVATRLTDGRVLVAGGEDGARGIHLSSEVFDPAVNPGPSTWSDANQMSIRRTDFASALLPDGRVLVAGGGTSNTVAVGTAEIWNPATGTWTVTAPLGTERHGHTLTLLRAPGCATLCGQVLMAAGVRRLPSDYLASAELFNPAAVPPAPPSGVSSAPPGAVRDLAARARSISRVTLTFSAPGRPPARNYVIKQSTSRTVGSEGGFARARTLCGGVCRFGPGATGQRLSLNVDGLRPKTTYFYSLRALDGAGKPAPLSNVASASTLFVRPGRVRGLRARAVSRTRIRLSFEATGAPPARRYVVKQSPIAITTARRFARARALCGGSCRFNPAERGDRIRLLVRRLRPGTRYCFAVRARDGRRLARRSRGACATTKGTRR